LRRGKLWGEDWMREGAWLEEVRMTGFQFLTTEGQTIIIPPKRVVEDARGNCTIWDWNGKRYELEVEENNAD
jgi:hypothetical protein